MANKRGNPNWVKGYVANPAGKKATGFQNYKTRANFLLEKYSRAELKAIAGSEEALDKLSCLDAIIIPQLAASIGLHEDHEFGALERERLLDRHVAKAGRDDATQAAFEGAALGAAAAATAMMESFASKLLGTKLPQVVTIDARAVDASLKLPAPTASASTTKQEH